MRKFLNLFKLIRNYELRIKLVQVFYVIHIKTSRKVGIENIELPRKG